MCLILYGKSSSSKVHFTISAIVRFVALQTAWIMSLSLSAGQLTLLGRPSISIGFVVVVAAVFASLATLAALVVDDIVVVLVLVVVVVVVLVVVVVVVATSSPSSAVVVAVVVVGGDVSIVIWSGICSRSSD